jgi:hypothetical protein
MTKYLTILVCIACIRIMPSLAQLYRWTDDAGRVHFTDNLSTIPPDRRKQIHDLSRQSPGTTGPAAVAPGSAPVSAPSALPGSPQDTTAGKASRLRQQAQALEQQIDAVLQERQQYREQLEAVRDVRMNPIFGRRQRRVADWGRSLAATERQLDALQAELQQVQTQLQEIEPAQHPAPSGQRLPQEVVLDQQGHSRAYWQRRLDPVRSRLHQAQQQRASILEQLAPETQGEQQASGLRGKEVLRLTRALEQIEQERRDAEAALQALRQEAVRAGAPAEWLQ